MDTPERLTSQEQEAKRKPIQSDAVPTHLSRESIDAVVEIRNTMFEEVEANISPLMRKALSIKLEGEQEAMESLLAEAGKRADAEKRRHGVLDTQLFKKKRLSSGVPARRNSPRTNAASKKV